MPYKYGNDNGTAITEVKYDRNMTNDELKDVGTKDMVPYKRDNNMMTKVKRPIETSDVDNDFMREYDSMHKSMEDRQKFFIHNLMNKVKRYIEACHTCLKTKPKYMKN